jgi:hypothetical protein
MQLLIVVSVANSAATSAESVDIASELTLLPEHDWVTATA